MSVVSITKPGAKAPILNRKVANKWNDLSGEQVMAIARIMANGRFTEERERVEVLMILLGAKKKTFLQLTDNQVADMLTLTDFIYGKNTLTKNVVPIIDHEGYRYLGPADELANISILEFSMADSYYIKVMQGDTTKPYIDYLAGCIYRLRNKQLSPKDPDYNGDLRNPFNSHHIEEMAKSFSGVALPVKMAVLFFYAGCRNLLVERCPNVFTPKRQDSARSFGWGGVIMELSGGKFGGLEQTRGTRMWDFFRDQEIIMVRNLEQKSRQKQQNA